MFLSGMFLSGATSRTMFFSGMFLSGEVLRSMFLRGMFFSGMFLSGAPWIVIPIRVWPASDAGPEQVPASSWLSR